MTTAIIIKLITIPLLLWLVSELSWRCGNLAGSLLAGLPCISGPISFFLTLEQGRDFGVSSAYGGLPGICCCIAFGTFWAWAARILPWWAAYIVSILFYAVISTLAGMADSVPTAAWAIAAFAAPAIGFALLPRREPRFGDPNLVKKHKVPVAQMCAGLAIMAAITMAAGMIGARYAGIFLFFPVVCSVVGIFVSAGQGTNALITLLRGAFAGMSGAAGFILTVGLMLPSHSLALTYGAALAVSLALSLAFVLVSRRLARAA